MQLYNFITSETEVINRVLNSIESGGLLLTYFNQHCFNIYTEDSLYKELIDSHFTVYQADLGIYLALNFFFKKKIKRIDATKMNEIILGELISRKYTLAIVGGNFEEEYVKNKATKRGINFVGYQNGYFDESQMDKVIKNLNYFNAQVYFIGMGVPKQEIFAEKLSQSQNSKVIICVGNFFEFYFKLKKRAPVFVQNIGMEWLFRLFTEPSRLWKRYLIGIPVFFFKIFRIKFFRDKL